MVCPFAFTMASSYCLVQRDAATHWCLLHSMSMAVWCISPQPGSFISESAALPQPTQYHCTTEAQVLHMLRLHA
jgi:hypothetical protein